MRRVRRRQRRRCFLTSFNDRGSVDWLISSFQLMKATLRKLKKIEFNENSAAQAEIDEILMTRALRKRVLTLADLRKSGCDI